MSELSEIMVRVGADVEPLKKGFKSAADRTKELSKKIGDTSKKVAILTTAIGAASAALGVKFIKTSLDSIDAQAKLARQIGTTSESIAILTRASELSGIEVKTLSTGARTLAVRLAEAADGTGQAVDALEKLGVTSDDLNGLDLHEKINLLNKALKDNVDPAQQAAVAADLFGQKAGLAIATMDPATLGRAADEVKRFGLAISDVDAAKVEAANDAMSAISMIGKGISQEFAVQLAPALQTVAEQITGIGDNATGMKTKISEAVRESINGFASILEGAAGVIGFVEENPDVAKYGLLGYMILGKKGALLGAVIGGSFDLIKEKMAEMGLAAPDAVNPVNQEIEVLESKLKNIQATIDVMSFAGISDDPAIDDLIEKATLLQVKISDLKGSIEEGSPAQQELNELLQQGAEDGFSLASALLAAAEALRVVKDASADTTAAIVEDSASSTQIVAENVRNMGDYYQDFYKENAAAMEMHRKTMAKVQKLQLSDTSSILGDLSALMQSENRKQFEIGKAAAKGQAVIDTIASAQSAFKAMAGIPVVGPALGAAAAGAAIAAGMVRLQQINSTQFGSSSVPSGGGASAGGSAAQGQASTGPSNTQTLFVEGINPGDLISGAQFSQLAETMLQFQRDGGEVVLV